MEPRFYHASAYLPAAPAIKNTTNKAVNNKKNHRADDAFGTIFWLGLWLLRRPMATPSTAKK